MQVGNDSGVIGLGDVADAEIPRARDASDVETPWAQDVAGRSEDASGTKDSSDGALAMSRDGSADAVTCATAADHKTTVVFVNRCAKALQYRGSNGVSGNLLPGRHVCQDVGTSTEALPAIRYWGYYTADPGSGRYTLAEFTFNTTFHDFDWYDISHVDAANVPMQIVPRAMPSCRTRTCSEDLVPGCPAVGQYRDQTGTPISCVSTNRDDPNGPVARYFHAHCPDAYSWSGDDSATTACAGEDYEIVFCP
jgi:hypothetical protein